MNRYLLGTVAVFALCATMAAAQSEAEQLVERLNEQGYSDIEVRQTGRAVHVNALKDGIEYEYLYNAITGNLIEQERDPNGEGDDGDSDDEDSQGGGFDRGEDGNHGHGNSDGYDEDNPGRSHDEDRRRSDRGENGGRGKTNSN